MHRSNNGRGVEADRVGQIDEFDHVDPPLATLKPGNPGLRTLQLLGELDLPNASLLALGKDKFNQLFMALVMNRFHPFRICGREF